MPVFLGISALDPDCQAKRCTTADAQKQILQKQIAKLSLEIISPEQVREISNHLDTWEDISFEDKRHVADLMISVIYATSESVNIVWKI